MRSFGLEEMMSSGASSLQGGIAGAEVSTPDTADEFAQHVIEAICHASVTPSIGRRAFQRCMRALEQGSTSRVGLRHPGKADAIDTIWGERERLFSEYAASPDKLRYLSTLPWVGPVTKHFLARRLGIHVENGQRAVA
jgi:hypothetical protein